MKQEQDAPRAFHGCRVPNRLFERDAQDLAFVTRELVYHFSPQAHFVNQVGRRHVGPDVVNLVPQLHVANHHPTDVVDQEHAEQKEREQENEARAHGCPACVRPAK